MAFWKGWRDITIQAFMTPLDPLPPPKTFNPKHSLTKLNSYSEAAPDWFWCQFPKNLNSPGKSRINHHRLEELAIANDFRNRKLLNQICKGIEKGENIGCTGPSRDSSWSTNAPSSIQFGEQVTDAIADWIKKGFAYGPIDISEAPKDIKVNGIMCKEKPNGSVRVILNLSSPLGCAVNEGIDEKDFPATMSSTTKWLRVLNRAGKDATFCKVDWSDAYKHVTVRQEDLQLQWFHWLGKLFCELCLIFGSKSSVGLYDRLAKVVLFIVCKESGMPESMVCQHLDDCAAAAPKGSHLLYDFDQCFQRIAKDLGISLAPRDDPEKSFGPSTSGVVFGVHYNTTDWTWAIPHEKLLRLLHMLQTSLRSRTISQGDMMSLCGKLLDVKPLVPQGRFHIDHILIASALSDIKTETIHIDDKLAQQLEYWQTMLRVCSGRVSIPNPDLKLPTWAIEFFTDASGGGLGPDGYRCGRGVGSVGPQCWTYVPWSRKICIGPYMPDGKRLNRKMSALELIGPLLVVSSAFTICKNQPVKVWVDNAGSVGIWRKGYSTSCRLSATIIKAINTIASGLGCAFDILKITRCSTPEAEMADALSKGAFDRFWQIAKTAHSELSLEPAWVPPQLTSWLENPREDEQLGDRILAEIGRRVKLLHSM